VNMRIATLPVLTGEKMVIRILDERGVLTGLKQLGLEPESLSLLQQLIRKPHGMIQVTGPIGSGKTTTLYSALNEVNVLTRNIVTIEDPVEYQLPGANQMQVNPQIGLSFVDGLRAILRQDADILMIGEIRDPETAKVAAWAALTGQLVLATLHTNDAPSAVTMMSNLQVPRYLLGSALVAVVAQRLVRRLCPHCKVPFSPPAKLLEEFGIADRPVEKLFYPGGCEQCYRTGFSGRTGIFEIFVVSERIRQMIIEGAVDTELKKQAISEGMITLAESGVRKLLDGVTSTDEVFRAVLL
jgi:type II secretory ATPase GspE/PulE/Tfp pilus assembly ATPase PilB-like protein